MRESENGANTPEPSNEPHQVATLEKDVARTEGLATQTWNHRDPDSPRLPSAGPALPRPARRGKADTVAPIRAHPRAAAPPTWPAPGAAPRGAPPTPPGGSPGRPWPPLTRVVKGAVHFPSAPKVPRFRALEAPRTPSPTKMRARILGPQELGLSPGSAPSRAGDRARTLQPDGAEALTQAANLEARRGSQSPARPALPQRLKMLLLALDQQDLLVDPA